MHAPHSVSPATPSSADLAQQSLGEIAVALPGATAVFRRLKLDFCCGGHVSLVDACATKGIDVDALVNELKALVRDDATPVTPEPSALVDHIVSRYHEVHRAQLPELIRMARRVEAVHRENPHTPRGLADALEAMEQELTLHMHKEEAVLFPMLRAGGNSFVSQPIAMMRHEHTDHGEALEHIARLTNDITPPPEACNTWRALYSGLAQLNDDLINHIHLENNVLFPQFEARTEQAGCGSGCGCS